MDGEQHLKEWRPGPNTVGVVPSPLGEANAPRPAKSLLASAMRTEVTVVEAFCVFRQWMTYISA